MMLPTVTMPKRLEPVSRKLASMSKWCGANLNFFRVHVLVFTFTPLIAASIFYACNGETHVKFVDSLFVCVSAMTVTGLITINISTVNGGQQAILFILMCIGNISAVSVTMIWIRRSFFRKKFDHVVRRSAKARKRMNDVEEQERRERKHNLAKIQRIIGIKSADSATTISENGDDLDRTDSSSSRELEAKRVDKKRHHLKGKRKPLRADMIRRIDGPAFLINSAGDPSNTIPDLQPSVIDQGPTQITEEPQSIEMTGLSKTPSPGGILTSPTALDSSNDSNSVQQQQPSIRISLPRSPSPLDNNAPEQTGNGTSVRRNSVPRGLSIPHSTTRYDPDADTDEEEEEMDDDEEAVDDQEAPNFDAPFSPTFRTRFPGLMQQQSAIRGRRLSDPPQSHVRRGSDTGLFTSYNAHEKVDMFPRSQTVEFAVPGNSRQSYDRNELSSYASAINTGPGPGMRQRGTNLGRTVTGRSYMSSGRYSSGPRGVPLARTQTSSKQRGFGGFPTPLAIAGIAIKKAMPGMQERMSRTMTMPRTSTFTSVHSGGGVTDATFGAKSAPYLSFDATVSGNSRFHELTEAQRDELGGVEYRALDLLAKLVPAYWLFVNLMAFTIVAPYINSEAFAKYRPVFESQGVNQPNYTWFWLFQVISAYSNSGLTLIDSSMTQMQDAYFLLITMGFLILAGNTAFPIVLRFFIWTLSKIVPSRSRLYETLQFLLDHPRRCFVYLFPSSQTWFLLLVLVLFNVTDWVAFLVLDLGNPEIESIKIDIRVFDGLFQSLAVRAAGFTVVSLLTLAPAVQFLYVIMMYLSAFPLALSVRSTNVYEEKSLGVYVDEKVENGPIPQDTDAKVWGSFLASHARRQLAFDIWWLGFALWLVCIIERDNIRDPTSNGWFTIFSCMFELTSAYGTVGLSTGTPYDNFSLSGRFHTLSKLVVIAVMIRGRHRGLPVAIDRAILLPTEQELEDMDDDDLLSGFDLDDSGDRGSTYMEAPTMARSQTRRRSSSADRNGPSIVSPTAVGLSNTNNGMSAVRRTQSGVSFALGQGRRGSIGKNNTMSPKQTEFGAAGAMDTGRSFSIPPSAMPLPGSGGGGNVPGNGGMPLPSGQLSAIDEMPSFSVGNGGNSTPLTESRAESPYPPAAPSTDPPSFKSEASSIRAAKAEQSPRSAQEHEEEEQAAAQYGCSTPEGRHESFTHL